METYRPLPQGLTIKPSRIDGLGLHTEKSFDAGTVFGETHVLVHSRDRHEWIRTPLGGFINHSDNPNCALYKVGGKSYLVPEQDIKPLEELTVKYTMYKV